MLLRFLATASLAFSLLGCSPSVDPGLKSNIDKRILSFPTSSDAVYDAPASTDPMPLAVGQWSRYKVTNKEGEPSLVTYKVVGEQEGAFWVEMVSETYYEKRVSALLVDFGDRKNLDSVDVKEMKQKIDDHSVTEYPGAVVGMMKPLWKPVLESMVVDWDQKEQDDARVPAGVFHKCYQAYVTVSLLGMNETSHTWSHPAVPFGGGVRSQSTDSSMSMVLVEFGLDGATSEIGLWPRSARKPPQRREQPSAALGPAPRTTQRREQPSAALEPAPRQNQLSREWARCSCPDPGASARRLG